MKSIKGVKDMYNVEFFYSEERGAWEVVVDGEWYFEGTYEQAEKVAESFWFSDED